MTKHLSKSLSETYNLAEEFVRTLKSSGAGATIVALMGDLGSGKTAFVQGVARALGVRGDITSPTFVLEKIYKLEGKLFTHLVHIDAYRLSGGDELAALGWDNLIADKGNLIVLEWPEIVEGAVPASAQKIVCECIDETTRAYTI